MALSILQALEKTCERSKDYTDGIAESINTDLVTKKEEIEGKLQTVNSSIEEQAGLLQSANGHIEENKNNIAKQEVQLSRVEKQIENINQHINEEYFITNEEILNAKNIPEEVCDYAQISSIGGLSHKSENLITYPYVDGDEKITSLKNNGIYLTVLDNGAITFYGKNNKDDPLDYILAKDLHVPYGTYTLSGTYKDSKGYGIMIELCKGETKKCYSTQNGQPVQFTIGNGDDDDGTYISQITLRFWNQFNLPTGNIAHPMLNFGTAAKPYDYNDKTLRNNFVVNIKSIGANLLPNEVHDFKNWESSEIDSNKKLFYLNIEEEGYYMLSSSTTVDETKDTQAYIYLQRWVPGNTYTIEGASTNNMGYFIANGSDINPLYFEHKKGYKWRLWSNSIDKLTNLIKDLQIQKVDKTTDKPAYEEYTETILEIPDTLTKDLPDYGCGIDGCYNTIDLENGVYIQRVVKKQISHSTYWWHYKNGPGDGHIYCCAPKAGAALEYQSSICSHFTNIIACWGEDASVNKGYKGPGYYSDHNAANAANTLYFKTHIPPAEEASPETNIASAERAANWTKYLEDEKIVMEVVYKLANPIITPLPVEFDEFLSIRNKKYVKFETNTSRATPNTITFLSKEV